MGGKELSKVSLYSSSVSISGLGQFVLVTFIVLTANLSHQDVVLLQSCAVRHNFRITSSLPFFMYTFVIVEMEALPYLSCSLATSI